MICAKNTALCILQIDFYTKILMHYETVRSYFFSFYWT